MLKEKFSSRVYLSFGENCLTDNILDRYNLKSFTTPFSHGRSNVEYILQMERDQYKDFVNINYIEYFSLGDIKVPRLCRYNTSKNNYHPLHENGFEFTHHDVIENEELREVFKKRVKRLKSFKSKEYILFYHHRYNLKTIEPLLMNNLKELQDLYSFKRKAKVIFFQQILIEEIENRRVEFNFKSGIHVCNFYTTTIWEGNDNNVLWAKCDDDLIALMIDYVLHKIK